MARTGWSGSNYLTAGAPAVTALPISMAAWFYTTNTSGEKILICQEQGAHNYVNSQILELNGNVVNAFLADGGGNAAASTTTFSANTWNHAAAVFTSGPNRAAYLNGGGKGTQGPARSMTTPSQMYVGAIAGGNPLDSGALLAEIGIWNIALTDADIAVLAKGVSPLLVRPEGLAFYAPLLGRTSPEINLRSNANKLTVTGSLSQAAHPRVFMPG